MKEKRKFNRLESKDKAFLSKEEGQTEEGTLLDVSPQGMRVLLNNAIKAGTLISGNFKIIPHSGHFYVQGEVIWAKPAGEKTKNPSYEVGIKFTKVSTISL